MLSIKKTARINELFTETSQYAAGTRPFGQPLVLGGIQENGSASSNPSPQLPNKRGTLKKRT